MRPARALAWPTLALLAAGAVWACGAAGRSERRGPTVLFASGADLQSINPLLTIHPLARQVQRYVLLTTLVRYDTALRLDPYLARRWTWSRDRRIVTLTLFPGLAWHDGRPTTARDAAWTLATARDPVTGYPRAVDLEALEDVRAADDTTLMLRFTTPQRDLPDVLTDLAILPAHLLDTVPRAELRRAAWNERPIGNGPFVFVTHEANRRWVFAANPAFPEALGGPPRLERLIVVVVDEPTTKLAALTAGELDFAGINPAHAEFVGRDPRLAVVDYPVIFPYGIVFNVRRPPFDDAVVRRAVALAVNRRQIVQGYLYGFARPADGPVPPEVTGYLPPPATPHDPDSARRLLGERRVRFELLAVGSGEGALEQMIQAQLARAGVEVVIRQLELSAFLDRVYGQRHEFDAAVMGIPGDLSLGYLAPLLRLAGLDAPTDPTLAQRVFTEATPVAFLYHARGVQGMNRRVRGVRMDVRGELATVSDWWVAP